MGLSGIFLKKRNEIEYPQIVEEIKDMLTNIGYDYYCEHEKGIIEANNYNYDYYTMNIFESEHSEKQWLMYVYGKRYKSYNTAFDWIQKGVSLEKVINIENFSDREDMLLKFAHEYFKRFPDDFFWDDLDWYYTKADIDAIMAEPFDKNWCYKRPVSNKNT